MFIFSNADDTAATWRFLYSNLCMELFRHRQTYLKSCYISRKTKAAEIPLIPLNVYSFQCRRHGYHMAFSLLESVHRIAPPMRIDSHHAILSEKLLHSRKAKRYSFHPYRLMFIFFQRRRHGCHRAFSLLEFVHRIAPPMRSHEK